jgi:hypothetical protein
MLKLLSLAVPSSCPLLVSGVVLLLGLPALAASQPAGEAIPPGLTAVISTPQGQVRGVVRNGVNENRGIPYACRSGDPCTVVAPVT